MIDVTLPISLPRANALLRMHWSKRRKLRTDYLNELLVAGVRSQPREHERKRVTITRILGPGQRRFDRDNLHASVKQLCDALTYKGLIFDDNPGWIDLSVDEDTGNRSQGPAVRVRVEPVE